MIFWALVRVSFIVSARLETLQKPLLGRYPCMGPLSSSHNTIDRWESNQKGILYDLTVRHTISSIDENLDTELGLADCTAH